MNDACTRRAFVRGSVALAALPVLDGCRAISPTANSYSVTLLGDTHFDAAPTGVYHGRWTPRDAKDFRDRQREFARNAEMWADRLPRLIAAAAATRRADTAFLLQMGDLIQGDCTDAGVQRRMLRDAEAACRAGFGALPFLTVCGNHDIRSGGAEAFDAYNRDLVARSLGLSVSSANFAFRQGPDAFVFVDFMRPDVARIHALLDETEGARHTFLVVHSTVAPQDGWGPYWFLLGKPGDADARRALFARLLARRVLVLCGHIHRTQLRRWRRGVGELVEFSANSVWTPGAEIPAVVAREPSEYGDWCRAHPTPMGEEHDGCHQSRTPDEILELLGEYREGLVAYRQLRAAGHCLLRVSDAAVAVDFFAGDARTPTRTFTLKGGKA